MPNVSLRSTNWPPTTRRSGSDSWRHSGPSEFGWSSIEVFVPIYDLLCELMALHGMAFARHGNEWRIVMSDEADKTPALKESLLSKAKR